MQEDGIKLRGQLLVYPITDHRCRTWSSTAFANARPFRSLSTPAVWEVYFGKPSVTEPPAYASPMHGKLNGLPPAYVETEQYDPWRDEGAEYAHSLAASAVDVELNEVKGTVHGFDTYAPRSIAARVPYQNAWSFFSRHSPEQKARYEPYGEVALEVTC